MTKTSTERKKAVAKPQVSDMPKPHQVDLAVLLTTYTSAMERLEVVQRQEQLNTGAAKTTLSDIGRRAILTWKPHPQRTYEPTPRSPNGKAPEKIPFRFKMAPEAYRRAADNIHGHGLSVTQVVEEALNRFAQTGK